MEGIPGIKNLREGISANIWEYGDTAVVSDIWITENLRGVEGRRILKDLENQFNTVVLVNVSNGKFRNYLAGRMGYTPYYWAPGCIPILYKTKEAGFDIISFLKEEIENK